MCSVRTCCCVTLCSVLPASRGHSHSLLFQMAESDEWEELSRALEGDNAELSRIARQAGRLSQPPGGSASARRVLAALAERGAHSEPAESVLWALGRHRFRPRPQILGALARNAREAARNSHPGSIANATWGLSRLSWRMSLSDASAFAHAFGRRWHHATAAEASMAAYSLASSASSPSEIDNADAIAWAVENCAPQLSAQGVSNCLWALQKLGQPAAVANISCEVHRVCDDMTPQGVCMAAGSLAHVAAQQVAEDSDAFHALRALLECCSHWTSIGCRDAAAMLWSLARLVCDLDCEYEPWTYAAADKWLKQVARDASEGWQPCGRAISAIHRLCIHEKHRDELAILISHGNAACKKSTFESKRLRDWLNSSLASYVHSSQKIGNERSIKPLEPVWYLLIDFRSRCVKEALHAQGISVHCFHRTSKKRKRGKSWPEHTGYSGCILRLSLSREGAMLQAASAAAAIREAGTMIFIGTIKEGIHGAVDCAKKNGFEDVNFQPLVGSVGIVIAHRYRGEKNDDCTLQSFREEETVNFNGWNATLTTWPGLFSGGLLDPMTALLLRSIKDRSVRHGLGNAALDVCCGSGIVAAYVAHIVDSIPVRAVDADALAVDAASRNLPQERAEVESLDVQRATTEEILGGSRKYHLIASNPPLHDHLEHDFSVLLTLEDLALRGLKRTGVMLIVVQDYIPLPSFFSGKCRVEMAKSDSKFAVWKIKRAFV